MLSKTLVLGLGNLLISDEGAGVRAVQQLQADYKFGEGVRLLDGGTLGLDLLPHLEGVTNLLILDAVEAGLEAGTLVRLEGEALQAGVALKISPHQVALRELLAAAHLHGVCPARVVLWGIQPACLEMGLELSPTVASQIDSLCRAAVAELGSWLVPVRKIRKLRGQRVVAAAKAR